MMSDYIQKYFSQNFKYYSILRDFLEIEIVQKFSELKDVFPVFSSCNRNFSIQKDAEKKRCNVCPKCVFVYTILRPFIEKEDVAKIWGEELYDNGNLLDIFKELR